MVPQRCPRPAPRTVTRPLTRQSDFADGSKVIVIGDGPESSEWDLGEGPGRLSHRRGGRGKREARQKGRPREEGSQTLGHEPRMRCLCLSMEIVVFFLNMNK